MKKSGITQRVQEIEEYGEYRDALDQRWSDLITKLECIPVPLANNLNLPINNSVGELGLSGVVLSGGEFFNLDDTKANQGLQKRNDFEIELIKYCLYKNIPILGVCRGMQVLNIFFGGHLTSVADHIGKPHRIKNLGKLNLPKKVNSFHSLGISKKGLADNLDPIALDQSGFVEAFQHQESKILGVMWHPERDNPFEESNLSTIKEFFT